VDCSHKNPSEINDIYYSPPHTKSNEPQSLSPYLPFPLSFIDQELRMVGSNGLYPSNRGDKWLLDIPNDMPLSLPGVSPMGLYPSTGWGSTYGALWGKLVVTVDEQAVRDRSRLYKMLALRCHW